MPQEEMGTKRDQIDQSSTWFQNRGLFSDHFLQARLPEWKEWEVDAELVPFRNGLLSLYQSKKSILPYLNEAQTEEEFVKPVLNLLGYIDSYIVQAPAKVGQHTNRPDYALFPDAKTKNRAYQKLDQNDYSLCIGIADAKYWERELDLAKSSDRDTFTNQNPSFQIAGYLTGTKQSWGILTNGRLWRLYSSKSHLPLGNYYQVDIVELLEQASVEILKYFYVLFRKQALLQVEGKSLLDRILEGSEEYAVELEADIKERAYDVVELLCRGFAADFTREQPTGAALKSIYDNSLTLLYRLLFVFYAEARELLPLNTSASYRENYSLRKLTHDIDDIFKKGYELSTGSTQFYHHIGNLFHLINNGDPMLGVPEYNGGLFDPTEHPFLEKQAIPDDYLVRAIHQLARITDKELKREVAVDYNTLSERHLGSIYEGLLEFKPMIAPHDLVIIKDKGSVKYAPADKHPGKKVAYTKDELYLANDKGERKASGSYYTPEYIVDYIVENTLDPLVEEAHEKVEALKPEVDKANAKWQELKEQKQGLEPTEKYDRKIAEESERLLEPYLSLKVLDPAMGSGHFLARATDFLAEAIATDPDIESPLELTEESELTYYRRRIVESCIYGVDLNPLAVELAKLTLWLTTMAKSKPLSFLNHHLRVGNSLIGARVADLDEIPKARGKKKAVNLTRAPVQLGLFQQAFNQKLYDLLQNRALIAQLPTETLEDVHNKQKWEKDFEHNMQRFRTLADVWVSTFFGNDVRWDKYNTLIENLRSSDSEWENFLKGEGFQKALALGEKKRFFHWELELPEVFYDEHGNIKANSGFDVVIGNPPYDVIAEKEQGFEVEPDKEFYSNCACLQPALGGKLNYYRLFSALSIWLCRPYGYHGFIAPMALIGDAQARPLRMYMLSHTQLLSIEAFPQKDDPNDRVFEEAKLSTCVYILNKRKPSASFSLRIHPGKLILTASPQIDLTRKDVELLDPNELSIPSMPGTNAKHVALGIALAKRCLGHRFKEVAISQQGEVNLTTHALFLSELPVGQEVLRGANVDRYEFNEEPKQGTPVYLQVKEFLRGKKLDSKAFDHKDIRIGYQRGAAIDNWRRIVACIIKPNNFCSDTINYIVRPQDDLYYVLGLLNSQLFEWRFRLTSTNNHVNSYEIDSLPLRPFKLVSSEKERKQVLEKAKGLYQEYLKNQNWDKCLAFVAERLPGNEDGTPDTEHEQSDVVHDLLAFLAEEMTRLNKEKQSRIKHFLTWLEKEIIKGSIEGQKNKTRIRNFHEATLEELMDVLKKNKVIPDPCPSNTWDTVSGEFYAAMNTLGLLKTTIAMTDKLIDQIVYKLYGLTDEEIAIVEAAPSV
jgi:Alw26I/Eco31I/Esp3I family type II restriction m6 adenine DNA methyltransferase